MSKTPYASIPEPSDDLRSLRETLSAVKQNLEVLMGIRGPRGLANQIYAWNPAADGPMPDGVKDGDLWLKYPIEPTDTWVMSVWRNGVWNLM